MSSIQAHSKFESKDYAPDKSQYYELIVFVSLHQLSISIYDSLSAKYLLLQDYSLRRDFSRIDFAGQLNSLLSSSIVKGLTFAKVNIIISDAHFTLVPEALYDSTKDKFYLSNVIGDDKLNNSTIFKQFLPGKLFILHAVPNSWINIFKINFGANFCVQHAAGLFVKDLQYNLPNKDQAAAFLYVRPYHCDIAIYKGKQLCLLNSFQYESTTDFLYFLVFMMEQSDVELRTSEVWLAGEIEKGSSLFEHLNKYVMHLKTIEPQRENLLDIALKKISPHFYFNLFSRNFENN